MAQTAPLLAVVVPTRNRHEYIISAIKSLLLIPSRDIEIIIEDNSDSNQLQDWIREHTPDSRIRYRYSNISTSQSGNYERAMQRVTAEYVAFIGDDDGVNPEIVEAAEWARAAGVDAVVPLNRAHFVWPDLQMRAKSAMAPGELRISPITGIVRKVDPEVELRKCVDDAGQSFHDLPRAYYGIVRREAMEQVRAKAGLFFPGVSPDLSAAIALANVTRKVLVVDYPLFLPGSSLRSNAGLSGLNQHVGSLAGQPHLSPDCEQNWSALVPPFFSVQTIWAEAAVEALIAMQRDDLVRLFNIPELYAYLIMFFPKYLRLTGKSYWRAMHRTRHGVGGGLLALLVCFFRLGLRRARSLVARLIPQARPVEDSYRQADVSDIFQAVLGLQEYLRSSGWSFGSQGVSRPNAQMEA